MNFSQHLASHITPEWKEKYIQYEELKAMLRKAVKEVPSADEVEETMITGYFAKFEEKFFSFCDEELKKINAFYSEKLAEATRRYENLKTELSEAQKEEININEKHSRLKSKIPQEKDSPTSEIQKSKIQEEKDSPTSKIQERRLAFGEFYISLILLQNYQNLNSTGFRNILHMHDELLNTDCGAHWRSENVEMADFHLNEDIDRLIRETKGAVARGLQGGDHQWGKRKLRARSLDDLQKPWSAFFIGLFSGFFFVVTGLIISFW